MFADQNLGKLNTDIKTSEDIIQLCTLSSCVRGVGSDSWKVGYVDGWVLGGCGRGGWKKGHFVDGCVLGWQVGCVDGYVLGREMGCGDGCGLGWKGHFVDGCVLGWQVGCIDGCVRGVGCDSWNVGYVDGWVLGGWHGDFVDG